MTNSTTKITILLAALFAVGFLGGCGKRANHVLPPGDLDEDNYPFIYPDPATDPGSQIEPQHQAYEKQPQQPAPTQDQP